MIAQQTPFVWDISFVEIFGEEKQGFDIVVGNPPYVRQEVIEAPVTCGIQITKDKKLYKEKLAYSVYRAFPHFFGYKANINSIAHKINSKNDLYIYFYFRSLSLLNDRGSFCFITSNSWLDVGYGSDLQEFLIKHSQVKLVLDNQLKRTFANADVNSVMVLLSAPDDTQDWGLDNIARFIMVKVPFEHILDPVIFWEIDEAKERKSTKEYRLFPIRQDQLLKDGCEVPDEAEDLKSSGPLIKVVRYIGNKWGGKYLRAPDIYWTILEKGAKYIDSISNYFDGERYLNTGGADGFFIITNAKQRTKGRMEIFNDKVEGNNKPFSGEIENEYLIPLIKDYTKTDKCIEILGYDAYCLVVNSTISPSVKEYIKWGEKQGYHRRSVTISQNPWYRPTRQMLTSARILVPRSFNDTFVIYFNPNNYLSLRYYRLHLKQGNELTLAGYLNSTLISLVLETLGNKNLGQGVLDFFMADFLALRIPIINDPELGKLFQSVKNHPILPVYEEYGKKMTDDLKQICFKPRIERQKLDNKIFEELHLTQGERDAVYEAVINLVESRLKKAGSLENKK